MSDTNYIQSFIEAVVNNDTEKVNKVLSELDDDELLCFLTQDWTYKKPGYYNRLNGEIALCAVLESGHHLEGIVNRISLSLRLELYLNPCYPDGRPAICCVFCGMRLRKEDKLPILSVLKIIHKSLTPEEWLQLFSATDVHNGLPLLGYIRYMWCGEESPARLRYILGSVDDPTDRLSLLQAVIDMIV